MYCRSTAGAETPSIEDRILQTSLPIRCEDDPESRRTSMELRTIPLRQLEIRTFRMELWTLWNAASVRCRTHVVHRSRCPRRTRDAQTGVRKSAGRSAMHVGDFLHAASIDACAVRVIACIPAIQAPRIAARSQPGCIGECMAQDDSEQNNLLDALPADIAAQWLPKLEPKLPRSVMKTSSAFRYSWAETRRPAVPSYKALPRTD